ncbi:alpha/beta hydrolase [Bacillus cytotoxicus]|uniref:Esterase n=1 Tax=Bacillus cytotoxicus (strain DSM 22905 / CIP 110041 / 391-98 / NVH 391-98) TaxID=315749 RepID=A7GR85_BACCN|nr:alpha/beta hydrolase-fold protein [Bacillus cytotoxicus]ABS22643.1 putative esterase [Bacillus cytotoxicus NVH 391-98]AWC34916.1 IroE protein [Bacillus cytotoxicus]AWC38913.1 IroE protein [Bacillus cytotoxicus]AWC46897.1 IroE protein [Bacillus cytotoxicus]AWC63125.1 IroE protein [Bacillus cytotoxicus]
MNTYIERETVIVSGAEQWEMYSDIGKRKYRIYISKPKQPAPDSGYPVIYVLDGNAYFQTFQEAMKVQSGRAEKTGVPASIIVGIGYPIEGVFAGAERCYDFTPYPLSVDAPPKPDGKPWPKSGGANKFLAFIQEELKPQIEKNFTINPKKQTIFGHSFGGLFALHILFTKVSAFQNYFICSPSIWWNNQLVLENQLKFIDKWSQMNDEVRVFLTVGGAERGHMLQDANALSERLSKLENHKFQFAFYEAEGENHASVVPTVLSKGLRFVSNIL